MPRKGCLCRVQSCLINMLCAKQHCCKRHYFSTDRPDIYHSMFYSEKYSADTWLMTKNDMFSLQQACFQRPIKHNFSNPCKCPAQILIHHNPERARRSLCFFAGQIFAVFLGAHLFRIPHLHKSPRPALCGHSFHSAQQGRIMGTSWGGTLALHLVGRGLGRDLRGAPWVGRIGVH